MRLTSIEVRQVVAQYNYQCLKGGICQRVNIYVNQFISTSFSRTWRSMLAGIVCIVAILQFSPAIISTELEQKLGASTSLIQIIQSVYEPWRAKV